MIRLNVEFNTDQAKAITRMARELDTTKAGVLRRALALLATARKEKAAGGKLVVLKDGKVLKEIIGF